MPNNLPMSFFEKILHVKTSSKKPTAPLQHTLSSNMYEQTDFVKLPQLFDTSSESSCCDTSQSTDCSPNAPTRPSIALTLPKFWETSPTAWFTVAESLFATQNIVSEQLKFHSVINSLEAKHIEKIKQVLMTTNLAQPYTSLKQSLVKSFEANENFKLNQLLSLPVLDPVANPKRPSELLLEMRCLLGQGAPLGPVAETLLKKLFLDKLPSQVRIILAALPEISLEELANKADSIMQVSNPCLGQGTIFSSNKTASASSADLTNQHLTQMLINHNFEDKLSKLTDTVNKLQDFKVTDVQHHSAPNPTSQNFNHHANLQPRYEPRPTFTPPRQQQNFRPQRFKSQPSHGNRFNSFEQQGQQNGNGLCYYHTTFGDRARKCTPPCEMASSKNVISSSQQYMC